MRRRRKDRTAPPSSPASVALDAAAPRRGPVTRAREAIGRRAIEHVIAGPAGPVIVAGLLVVVVAAVFAGALLAELLRPGVE